MPWRKYKSITGKHGPIYHIAKGIQVRCEPNGKWRLFIEKGGERKNKIIGSGRENLVKAIKAAEKIAAKVDLAHIAVPTEHRSQKAPLFRQYSEDWLNNNTGRWDKYTYQRYEIILRLHLWPHEILKGKKMDEITRSDVKQRLRLLLKTHLPNTIELVHTVLCGIFQEAVDDEIVPGNPTKGLLKKLLPPKNRRNVNDADPFDIEERDRFLSYAESRCN